MTPFLGVGMKFLLSIFVLISIGISTFALDFISDDKKWDLKENYVAFDSIEEDSVAFIENITPSKNWEINCDITIKERYSNGIGISKIVFGSETGESLLWVNVESHITGISLSTVNDIGGGPHLDSRAIPGGDMKYFVRLSRKGLFLKVKIWGESGFIYEETTLPISEELWSKIKLFGVGTSKTAVIFENFSINNDLKEKSKYETLAETSYNDLIKNFWVAGGIDTGYIMPTYNGYTGSKLDGSDLIMDRGAIWERGIMLFALDGYYKATKDETARKRIVNEWNRLKKIYTKEELVEAGGRYHPACDDTGWDSMLYQIFYDYTKDPYAIEIAKELVKNGYDLWHSSDLGGGIWYNNSKEWKSLYQVGVINASLNIYKLTKDKEFLAIAEECYNWNEKTLLREDGLYWNDYDKEGPMLKDRYDDIFEGGSVTCFMGNMGMTVAHIRFYDITGDKQYLDRALRTAEGIEKKHTKDGVYFNDRDPWANASFVNAWTLEVLPLEQFKKYKQTLLNTAVSIFEHARLDGGYYGPNWSSKNSTPESFAISRGFRPNQIMTSATTANVVMAAALADITIK